MKKQAITVRAPLSNEELEVLSSDDFVRLRLSDDEKARLREINRERQEERAMRSARLKVEEAPILRDLREVGLDVGSLWDFVNVSYKYPEAIPVLLKHLTLPYSDRTREGIARSLAVPELRTHSAWPILVEQYRIAPMGKGIVAPGDKKEYRLGARDGLACALSVAVTDETLSELIALAKDRTNGDSRVLLLPALRSSKSVLAKQALKELADDPELAKEIASW